MAEPLKIELDLDASKASAASAEYHRAEKQRVEKLLSDSEVAERARADFARRTNQQRIAEAKKTYLTEIELKREQEREEKRIDNRVLTETEIRERAKREVYRQSNQARIAEATKAGLAEQKLSQGGVAGMQAMAGAVAASAAGMAGLGSAAVSASEAIEAAFKQAREQARAATNETLSFQKTLLQMSGMSGAGTREELRATIGAMGATGLSFEGASALRTEGQLGARGFANDAEFRETIQRAGRLATITGQSGGDVGKAVSMIGDMGGGVLTADQAEVQLLRASELAKRGGVGVADFLREMRQSRDLVAGGALTEDQAGGLLALYAARGGGAGEVKALAEATAGDRRGTLGAAMGWSDQIAAARAKGGAGFNAIEFLQDQGITGEGAKAISEFAAARPRWDQDIAPLIAQPAAPGTINQKFAAMANDPAVRQNRVDAATQLTTIGLGGSGSLREQARRLAFEQMRASGQTTSTFEAFDSDVSLRDLINPWNWGEGINRIWYDETRSGLDQRAMETMLQQAKAAGIDIGPGSQARNLFDDVMSLDPNGLGRRSEAEINARFNQLGGMIQSRGGDPLPGLDKFLEGADKILRAAEINAANARQQVPAPLQMAPRQPPAAAR